MLTVTTIGVLLSVVHARPALLRGIEAADMRGTRKLVSHLLGTVAGTDFLASTVPVNEPVPVPDPVRSLLILGPVSARVADFLHRLRACWLTTLGFSPLGVTSRSGNRRRAMAARVTLGPVAVAQ